MAIGIIQMAIADGKASLVRFVKCPFGHIHSWNMVEECLEKKRKVLLDEWRD